MREHKRIKRMRKQKSKYAELKHFRVDPNMPTSIMPDGELRSYDLQYRACRLWVQVWSMYTIPTIEWGPFLGNLLDEIALRTTECRADQLL